MKKVIISIISCFLILSQAVGVVAYASNPLQLSDRVTQKANAAKEREQDIQNKRATQASTNSAFTTYGINSGDTDDFSFYLNRKYMTKREYEAFKWSFIFTQFAKPLQQSLLDVLSEPLFEEMVNLDMTVDSVQSTLERGGINPNTDKVYNAMLQDVNFSDLVDVINKNYAVYPVHDSNGNSVTLKTMLSGTMPLYQPLYIYDTIWKTPGDSEISAYNSLLYNQHVLGDEGLKDSGMLSAEGNLEQVDVPVFVYTAQTFMYMQLAVVAYIQNTDVGSIQGLVARRGTDPIVVDTYGNICALNGDVPTILVPNFANPYLTSISSELDETPYIENISLYNAWFTAFYTQSQRARTSIYPEYLAWDCIDQTVGGWDPNTGEIISDSKNSKSDFYSGYLTHETDKDSLRNSIILVEPSCLWIDGLTNYDKFYTEGNVAVDLTNFINNVATSHYGSYDYTQLFPKTNSTNEQEFWMFHSGKSNVGDLYSPFQTTVNAHVPFSVTVTDDNNAAYRISLIKGGTRKVADYFINKNPLYVYNVDFYSGNGTDNEHKLVYYKLASMLEKANWQIQIGSKNNTHLKTIFSGRGKNEPDFLLGNVNNLAILQTCFRTNQVIPDNRFTTVAKGNLGDGSNRVILALPEIAIDLGQAMDAFALSEEKGMFLADYAVHFSGTFSDFQHKIFDSDQNDSDSWLRNLKIIYSNRTVRAELPGKFKGYFYYLFCENSNSSDGSVSTKANLEDFNKFEFWNAVYSVDYKSNNSNEHNASEEVYVVKNNNEYSVKDKEPEGDEEYRVYHVPREMTLTEDVLESYPTKPSDLYSGDEDSYLEYLLPGGENGDTDGPLATAIDWLLWGAAQHSTSIDGFFNIMYSAMSSVNVNSILRYVMLTCDYTKTNVDKKDNGLNNLYWFDEYRYFLRDPNLSGTIGVSNGDDFATVVYYWDRYYLTQMAFNKALTQQVYGAYTKSDNPAQGGHNANSPKISIENYEKYLTDNNLTETDCTFMQYLEQNAATTNINYFSGNSQIFESYALYAPYCYEYQYQSQTYEEYLAEYGDYDKFDDAAKFYTYLDDDTIVIYPFSVSQEQPLITFAGLGDAVALFNSGEHETFTYTETDSSDKTGTRIQFGLNALKKAQGTTTYDPLQYILSLQKNTDYTRNVVNTVFKRGTTNTTVTKEELMESAAQFFENPVSSLTYIIAGFMYQVHSKIATGDIGNVFSISWLLETDAYKWVIDRYVALVTIAVIVLLSLKLTQLAMSKTRDFSSIAKSLVGIFAMCLVPLIIFNSFIWAFQATSKWALGDAYNKILLSQIDNIASNANRDAAVETELIAFKEQFSALEGTYDGATFEFIESYSYNTGAQYNQVPLKRLIQKVGYKTTDKSWYGGRGYDAIHSSYYAENLYYYFYDYIKSEYLVYCQKYQSGNSNTSYSGINNFIGKMQAVLDSKDTDFTKTETQKQVQDLANGFATLSGGFRGMLEDVRFVYGPSVDGNSQYGTPQAKDLVGLYNVFDRTLDDKTDIGRATAGIRSSQYMCAFEDSDELVVNKEALVPVLWTDQDQYNSYFSSCKYRSAVNGKYPVITSRLDLFNPALNGNSANVNSNYYKDALTPFEVKLCNLTNQIYEDTLNALSYLPEQIHDESGITMMALIATFRTCELMGYEPTGPILDSITLDTIVRATFITDLQKISQSTNTLYSMVQQGDSIGKVALVLVLELIICVASISRVVLVLFITGGTFAILALRLLHKAPQTLELLYGVVGNLIALVFLHALTLFLVVVGVEWVAGATSAIPGLVLDLMMIAFVILISWLLIKMVTNIVKDFINLGGTKIRQMTHTVAKAVVNAAGKIFNKGDTDTDAENVNINANLIHENIANANSSYEDTYIRRARIAAILENVQRIESEEMADSEDAERQSLHSRVEHNLSMRDQIT